MNSRRSSWVFLCTFLLLHQAGAAAAKVGTADRQMTTVTAFSYTAGSEETPETAKALALYGAKHKAVVMAADQLAEEGLLKADANRKMAIYCLVADAMQPVVLEQSIDPATRTYTVKIKSVLSLTDYVKADIRNQSLEKEEVQFSLKEEMEPDVPTGIAPALELSRAYRYISNHHWRMAVIYMDHLETKYPHWGALHLAKANAFLEMNEKKRALSALNSACYLGVEEACLKVNGLDPSD